LALYHCDEGKGETLRDSSGQGHHGKIVGAKWVRVDGSPIDLKSTFPPPAIAPAADRQVAERLLPHVARLTFRLKSGSEVTIFRHKNEPIPAEPFDLIGIDFLAVSPPPGFTSDVLLPAIGGLQKLERISCLYEGSFSTAELARLVESPCAPKLTDFSVGYCDLNAENLDLLKKLPKLERLALRASRPTAALFSRLKAEHPAVRYLDLCDLGNEQPLDEAAGDGLAALPLEELMLLHNGKVDRLACRAIARISDLKSLTVNVSSLNDEAAAEFGRCSKLEKLNLNFTAVTDQVLPALGPLAKLKEFDVFDAKATEPELRKFAQSHPQARIYARGVLIQPSK
jgi:hypothetical protein